MRFSESHVVLNLLPPDWPRTGEVDTLKDLSKIVPKGSGLCAAPLSNSECSRRTVRAPRRESRPVAGREPSKPAGGGFAAPPRGVMGCPRQLRVGAPTVGSRQRPQRGHSPGATERRRGPRGTVGVATEW